MSWKDRAEKVESTSDWKSRAEPTDHEEKNQSVGEMLFGDDGRTPLEVVGDALNPVNMPKNAMAALQKVAEEYDKYVSGPTRKLITEAISGKELDENPTGKEQAKMMGFSDKTYNEMLNVGNEGNIPVVGEVSPAGVMGAGLEMVEDPLAYAGALAKPITNLGRKARDLMKLSKGVDEALTVGKGAEEAAKGKSFVDMLADAVATTNPDSKALGILEQKGAGSRGAFSNWPKPSEELSTPQKIKRMREMEGVLTDLQYPPRNIHYEMLKSEGHRRDLQNKIDLLPPKERDAFREYNQGMAKEAQDKIEHMALDIAGDAPKPIKEAGEDAIQSIADKYDSEKEMLRPAFDYFHANTVPLSPDEAKVLAIDMGEGSRVRGLYKFDAKNDTIGLRDWDPDMGMSKEEYGILTTVVERLNQGVTFNDLQNIRDYMRKSIDPSHPAAYREVENARKNILKTMEGMTVDADRALAKAGNPSNKVSQLFRSYAMNEKAKESLEKIIGGHLDPNSVKHTPNVEKVMTRILARPDYAQAYRQYVGNQKFNELMGSFISEGIRKATHSANGFRPEAFQTWLKSNSAILSNNLTPEAMDRLNALGDAAYFGKRFQDMTSPGTAEKAASIIGHLKDFSPQKAAAQAVQNVENRMAQGKIRKELKVIDRMPKPSPLMPESAIDRAKRLNFERKVQKGKLP